MLEIKDLTRRYGKKTVLDGVSFSIPRACVWGIVGPNGAGKTTLLRAVAGFDEAEAGDVLWCGKSLLDRVDLPLDTAALMPDVLSNVSDMTVKEYLDFYARAAFPDFEKGKETVERSRTFCGVPDEWLPLFLHQLSRGMKQRVSLARMLIFSPDVLLFDEPGAGLDPRALVGLRKLFLHLARQGHTVVVSSHILSELAEIVSGVAFLNKGRLLCSDSTEKLLARYDVPDLESLYLKIIPEE